MFSQKKKRQPWIWIVLAIIILMIGIFIIVASLKDEEKPIDANVSKKIETEKTEEKEETTNKEFFKSYYLIKYEDDSIKIFFSDEGGRITELEETSIVFETLSIEDQNKFKTGIKVDNRDELNRIIMDYES